MNRRDFLTASAASLILPSLASASCRKSEAKREEKAGWICLKLEGEPREIGFQHGSALAKEIDDAISALKLDLNHENSDTWERVKAAGTKLFSAKLEPEYREEMEGIAAGIKSKGYAYDFADILAYNAHIEITGYYFPLLEKRKTGLAKSGAPTACSAFVATGSATSDGKIVMGHNLWWDYLMGQRWRVLLDIRPKKGNRFIMDALPGFIHSGSDFALNANGILVTETTIGGFMGFDPDGIPEFIRMRKATQYANSLDDFLRVMKEGNNGGYANTWLLGDVKTNEIGKLELGLKNVIFSRSKDGFFYGANFPEDPTLTREECYPGAEDNLSCRGRRPRWKKLLDANKGKLDVEVAKTMLADTYDETTKKQGASIATLCGRADLDSRTGYSLSGAVNTKIVTSALAKEMKLWARMGFSDGSSLNVAEYMGRNPKRKWLQPYLRDIPAQPWILQG
ncbi:MAG: peptidase C45 [Chthonomonadaceae bacterium]|nr:peptidase C45 [Chthonomonadaceae bacterium]